MNFDFSKLGNIQDLIGNAKKMQENMKKVQEKLQGIEFDVESGAGLVKVKANAKQEILAIVFDPSIKDEKDFEFLQDLTVSAVNEALRRAREISEEEMTKASGLDLSMVKNMLNF